VSGSRPDVTQGIATGVAATGVAAAPVPVSRRSRQHLTEAAGGRGRRPLTPGGIARRRVAVNLTKWLLPLAALALLGTIALWPEIERATDQGRVAFKRIRGEVGAAQVTDATYRSVDERGRPYTLTASIAQQVGPERVDLTDPKGDLLQENGTWLMLQSTRGVYMQHAGQLDLSQDVLLYRDDGTTMRTASAAIDLKNGAVASADLVRAEGPFGTLDSHGFTLTDKGELIQFAGPARLLMNAHNQ
jgi:lipopolysaccharide export system protein LptC